jgi:hypothetical protein
MLRAIIGWLAIFGAVSLAHAASGPLPITQYETPAGARWAPFSSDLPKCDDGNVTSTISGRFDQTENTFWGGKNAVLGFGRIREIGFRSAGPGASSGASSVSTACTPTSRHAKSCGRFSSAGSAKPNRSNTG